MAEPRSSKALAATAHHEAGHAVVGFWAEVPTRLIQVSVVPDVDAGTLGHVRRGVFPKVRDVELGADGRPRHFYRAFNPEFDDARLVERQLRPRVVECFAGVLAEKRFTGRNHNWVGASSDMETAVAFIGYLTGSDRQAQALRAYLWAVAEDSVRLRWQEIERLAEALLTRQSMTGREVKQLLQSERLI